MKFVLLFIAAVSAIQLEKDTPAADAHKANMLKTADGYHKTLMDFANESLDNQKAGVAASAADIAAYKAAHR